MQISTFKLSDVELESGFLMQNTLKLIILTITPKKIIEYMQHFLRLRFSILY